MGSAAVSTSRVLKFQRLLELLGLFVFKVYISSELALLMYTMV